VHITGTNGKGSTANMLAAILQSAGYKTGLYTSPHLKDFRERIRINGKMIPEKNVTAFVEKYKKSFEKIEPSFFEWTVGLAFDYFRNEKVDIAIIEAGLGGRLDSTNVITPILSVITNVGWDHMNLLGHSLEKIASEKAGIIKKGVTVVVGESQMIKTIFAKEAKDKNSKLIYADKEVKCAIKSQNISSLTADIFEKRIVIYKNMEIGLGGAYQAKNVQAVMVAANVLRQKGFLIRDQNCREGLKNVAELTGFAGRWHVLSQSPLTIADTAHNEDGLRPVIHQLEQISAKRMHIVLGFSNDKDAEKILNIFPRSAAYYFCRASVPRAMDELQLQQKGIAHGLNGAAFKSVPEALESARKNAAPNDVIFIGGSSFVVGDAL
jgi:dihydrofolate synthase/folylpolyglutamate synthase